MNHVSRRRLLGRAALATLVCGTLTFGIAPLRAQSTRRIGTSVPAVRQVAGKPALLIGNYDLGPLGYEVEEFFLSGTAGSYRLAGPPTSDGRWTALAAAPAPYATRVVVIRPSDPRKFSGTVLLEWLNVTAGQDTGADWMVAHREILRRGHAWIGVSAQKVGVEGGQSIMGAGQPLKKLDPARYGSLLHPGDAWSFDIFSQAGAAVKARGASGLLGPLVPRRVVGIGESQSAAYLTTYVNAVDPVARVYDGFFIHSRFGSGAAIDGSRMSAAQMPFVRFRPDLRVPLLTLITETDLLGGGIGGYAPARRPDDAHLRVWEVAGASHADNYLFGGAFIDSGQEPVARLAKVFLPTTDSPTGKFDKPFNEGMVHHYVVEAALAALDKWLRTGRPPASTPQLELASTGTPPQLALDANGLARGGVRTPWTDVPTLRLSGVPAGPGFLQRLVGSGEPFDAATLTRLYPGGKADYLARFTRALDAAIATGHVLPEDRAEIMEIAALNYPA